MSHLHGNLNTEVVMVAFINELECSRRRFPLYAGACFKFCVVYCEYYCISVQ